MSTSKKRNDITGENTTMKQTHPKIILFTKNDCGTCSVVKKKMTDKDIPFQTINVEEDKSHHPELDDMIPYDYIVKKLGLRQMPVTAVFDSDADAVWEGPRDVWSGARPDKIREITRMFADNG